MKAKRWMFRKWETTFKGKKPSKEIADLEKKEEISYNRVEEKLTVKNPAPSLKKGIDRELSMVYEKELWHQLL